MHLQLIVRGIISQVRLWESMMQNHFFKWRRINTKTGKEEITLVQGGLRPSVLGTYEFVFPEESLPEVLNILGLKSQQDTGTSRIFKYKVKLAVLRKICGVKIIPKEAFEKAKNIPDSIYFDEYERGLSSTKIPGVAIHPIGIKEDTRIIMFDPALNKEFEQEGL